MTEIARFFDLTSYSESDQAEIQNRFRREGVLAEAGNKLAVAAPGGMFVSINTGEAMVEGFQYKNTASLNLAVANNTSGSTRVDRAILRLDRVANTLVAAVLQGTPGAGLPALTQVVGGTWEFALATLTIPTATTSAITSGMIADTRLYSRTVKYTEDVEDNIIGYQHLITGGVSNLLLNYHAVSDLWLNSSLTGGVYNVLGSHPITVSSGCTALIIAIQISLLLNTISGSEGAVHIQIDGAQRYMVSPAMATAGAYGATSGTIIIPGLSAGAHTIAGQLFYNSNVTQVYCRPGTQPTIEGYGMQIVELRK